MTKRMFKRLSRDNWREEEPHLQIHVRVQSDGTKHKPTADDWADDILRPELSSTVPEDIRNLFEVAQGAMCYGCFFYPLFTLGHEQMFRVMEAALTTRARQLSAPIGATKSFARCINWFASEELLPPERVAQWEATKHLRNTSSHADRQSLYTPAMAAGFVHLAKEFIDELYALPCNTNQNT